MREIISLHLGQTGVQVGSLCWQLFCLEHGLKPDGQIATEKTNEPNDDVFKTFFSGNDGGKHVPRSIFFDSDPVAIDAIRTGNYRQLFEPEQLVSVKEDAANNFGRGKYLVANQNLDLYLDKIRKMAEKCTDLQGFLIYNSVGGGTGSGMGSVLLEKLAAEYEKKIKVGLVVYPSPKISSAVIEPYNAVLATNSLSEYMDATVVFDNEALYDICQKNLDVNLPNHANLNEIIAQVTSSITTCMRFKGSLNTDLAEFQTNLVPHPRIHYILSSYAPIYTWQKPYETPSVAEITDQAFKPENMMAKCDPSNGKYIACCLIYRGDVVSKNVAEACSAIKTNKIVQFVDWCPSGIKAAINQELPITLPGGELSKMIRSVCKISNSTAISQVFSRIMDKFDKMYAKRAYVHWFCGEGVEEADFSTAREALETIQKDYEESAKDSVEGEDQENSENK